MEKVDETHYTLTMTDINDSHRYKYLCGPSWDYEEYGADGQRLPDNRHYAENDVVAMWKAVPPTTAIDNAAMDAKAAKTMVNGQLLILRGDKNFNALGAEVK